MGDYIRGVAPDGSTAIDRRRYADARRKAIARGAPFAHTMSEWLARKVTKTRAATPAERAARQAAARKRFAQSARGKYKQQRDNAAVRGVGFLLTFGEWCEIWEESGHWDERGNFAEGYVMARNGDEGPYAVGNVRIARHVENVAERNRLYFAARRWEHIQHSDDYQHVHGAPFSGEPGPDVPF